MSVLGPCRAAGRSEASVVRWIRLTAAVLTALFVSCAARVIWPALDDDEAPPSSPP